MTMTKSWRYHPKEWIVGLLLGIFLLVGRIVLESQDEYGSYQHISENVVSGMKIGNGLLPSYIISACETENNYFCAKAYGFPLEIATWYDQTRQCVFSSQASPQDVSDNDELLKGYLRNIRETVSNNEGYVATELELQIRTAAIRVAVDTADADVRKQCAIPCADPSLFGRNFQTIPAVDRQKVLAIAKQVLGPDFVDLSTMTASTSKCEATSWHYGTTLLTYLLKNSWDLEIENGGGLLRYKKRTACLVQLVLVDGYSLTPSCRNARQNLAKMSLPFEAWLGGIPVAGFCLVVSLLLALVTIIATHSSHNRHRKSEASKERAERKLRESLEDPLLRSSLEKRLKNQYGDSHAEVVINNLEKLANQSVLEQHQAPADFAWKQEEARRTARVKSMRLIWTVRKVLVGWFGCHFGLLVIDWAKAVILLDSMTVLSFSFVVSYIFLPTVKEDEIEHQSPNAPLEEPLLGGDELGGVEVLEY